MAFENSNIDRRKFSKGCQQLLQEPQQSKHCGVRCGQQHKQAPQRQEKFQHSALCKACTGAGGGRAAGWKGEAKMPWGTTVTHAKSCILLGESDFTLYLPFPTSPAPNGQMWLLQEINYRWRLKKKGEPPLPHLSTTRLFPLQTWGWMGRPGKTGRWKTHYRCEVWRIRLRDNLRVVNFNFGGLNALLSNTKQIGNKKPHERDA